MKLKLVLIFAALFCFAAFNANANTASTSSVNMMDELNPFDPNIEEILKSMDAIYEAETGVAPLVPDLTFDLYESGCYQHTCTVYAQIVKSTQRLYLYINGNLQHEWLVSTGERGHETPLLNRHPNGRIYQKYTSKSWPGGDYKGLGNMPYAIFIQGGFAIHGTAEANWKKLGQKASHGCIRLHPDNARYFNQLVRKYGIKKVWISVQE